MKHLKLVIAGVAVAALSALSWVGVARAQAFTQNVDAGKTVNGSVYSAGKQIRIAGVVDGDVYCAGQQVIISGTVKGDVICAAQTITISGKVEGSVRAAGQLVTLQNTVERSASIAASQITMEKKASIGRDATFAGGTLALDGTVKRDAVIASADTTLTGTIGRNLRFTGSTLQLQDRALVAGTLEYTSSNSATIASTAAVKGAVTHHMPKHQDRKVFDLGSFIIALIMMTAFALTMALIFPQQIHRVSAIAANSLGKTLLAGLLATVVVPVGLVALSLTLVGIPLALFGLMAWILLVALSMPIAAYYLGSMVLSKAKNALAIMAVGVVLLVVLMYIPLVGWFAAFVAYFIGTGALVRQLKQRLPSPNYHVE
ncbi:MAG TPA: polymer-forming cytoskeletal protein [Candidatus Saccharimonadales bacterium]|nr:polymer-forming cytoskeletal protein [Candidatus Saccharimonadales bacterium]